MEKHTPEEFLEPDKSAMESESGKGFLWTDFTGIIPFFHACFERISTAQRKKQIEKILNAAEWVEHYKDKRNGRRVLAESRLMQYPHELETAIALASVNYDVIFAPKAMFLAEEKKFDVFLIKDTVILKADLKFITTKNPDNIARRIKKGADQASRLVIHIKSDIEKKALIDGLQSGVKGSKLIREILLLFKRKFYRLTSRQILSKNIFKILQ